MSKFNLNIVFCSPSFLSMFLSPLLHAVSSSVHSLSEIYNTFILKIQQYIKQYSDVHGFNYYCKVEVV